jgi:hypothetical protein
LAAADGRQEMNLAVLGHGLAQAEPADFGIDDNGDPGTNHITVAQPGLGAGVKALQRVDDLADAAPGGGDDLGAAGEVAHRGGDEDAGHTSASICERATSLRACHEPRPE